MPQRFLARIARGLIRPRCGITLALAFLIPCCVLASPAHAQTSGALIDDNSRAINFIWTLLAAFLVMLMQAGFGLMESGMSRAKNVAHTMSMNFLVYSLAMIGFFVCGFAFMMGGINGAAAGASAPLIGGPAALGLNGTSGYDGQILLHNMLYLHLFGKAWGICGYQGFLLRSPSFVPGAFILFFYMMVLMSVTATIPTGALAERWSFKSFSIFSICVGAFIFAVYGCWMWGGGWLASLGVNLGLGHGAVDYAGSSVVHLQGGTLAFILALMIGPRIGKYEQDGSPRPIFGHSMPMVMVGTLLLAFSWFGFNIGSAFSGMTPRIAVIAVNTALASASATVTACLYMWKTYGKPDPSVMCNGMLGGLVAITASCAFVSPVAAFFIGIIAGLIVVWGVLFMERKHIDDPVGAISVHGIAGLWGLLAVGLFANGTWGDGYNNVAGNVTGLFYGDHSPKQFEAQLIAAFACLAWNLVIGGAVFYLIGRFFGSNRVRAEVEVAGLDIPEMGAPGYPEFTTHISQEQVGSSDVSASQ